MSEVKGDGETPAERADRLGIDLHADDSFAPVDMPEILLGRGRSPGMAPYEPIDPDKEIDRTYELCVTIRFFGKERQARAQAISKVRQMMVQSGGLKQHNILEARYNGEPVPWDSFEDDKGEYWHALDWTKEEMEDEGLHPDVT